ncbi:MAG: SMP-30/gluconolactonase/LRE family protein [Winogradskyella sp.]|nr:SMP-30/gluconolactonase/LRE family protein [Winogradskyella sp.]
MNPLIIFQSDAQLLEGPVFDLKNKLLYFVSILDYIVYCYNPTTNEILSVQLDSPVSCIFIRDRKKVLVSSKKGFFKIDFDNLTKEFEFQLNIPTTVRYNDGIEDSEGRLLIGTMGYPEVINGLGNVYSYFNGGQKTIITETTISNGMAFSLDNQYLYFIDTPTKKVAKYKYDINSGDARFESYVIEFKSESSPDGMCIDEAGMLWIAEWGGACVSQWNPINGEKLRDIELPSVNVTSCCFDNLSNLYVTTAESDIKNDKIGSGLFYIELN